MEKLQNIGIGCIKIALIADEKYHLHEYASEALYSIVSALLRAIVAYKDTPPPSNSTSNNQNQEITKTNSLSILPKSLSA